MGKRYNGRRWVYSYCEMQNLLLDRNKDKIVGCMWDIFTKHVGRKIVIQDWPRFGMKMGGIYIAKDCGHLKIMTLYAQRGSKLVLTQVNKPMGKGNWKMVQMKTLFHVLTHGCPNRANLAISIFGEFDSHC